MKKIIDFLLIFILAFFAVSIFTNNDDSTTNDTLTVTTLHSAYKVPNFPILQFSNGTSEDVAVNLCEDINLRYAWETLPFTTQWCESQLIEANSKRDITLVNDNKIFEKTWVYTLDLELWEKKYTNQFEMKNRGTFSKIFVYVFYAPIYNLMAYILTHTAYSLGFAIILLTIIVRIILIYPQHKMIVNQQKMQSVQPKIKAIQEKHKWNQAVLWQELLALYKKEWVNPVGSCWFLLIQMPFLLVIYNVIRSVMDESNSFYIYNFVSYFRIESINPNFFWIDLLEAWGIEGGVLAIVVWFLQYLQIKLSLANNANKTEPWAVLEKKKDSNDFASMMPDPEMMNKFMLYGMPWMVAVFTFFFFAWLWLYWGITTIFMILQQIIVSKKRKMSS